MRLIVLAVALFLAAASSAAARVPFCPGPYEPGIFIKFEFGFGKKLTEMEKNEVFLRLLRMRGVDATGVRQWNGCLRAFVRDEDGRGEHLEYYEPDTLERIELD